MLKINNDEIKLIITDIDGTLLNDNCVLLENVKNILINLQERGVLVSIASGRLPKGFISYAKMLKIHDYLNYVIGANGAVIMNINNENYEYCNLISKKNVKNITEMLINYNCDFLLTYINDNCLYCNGQKTFLKKLDKDAYLDGQSVIKRFDMNNICESLKIVVYANNVEDFKKLLIELKKNNEINIEILSNTSCDIISANSNKGVGIANLIKIINRKYNISLNYSNIIYFGDNYNDVSAFKYVKYGIAIEHSPKIIKDIAYDVTVSNNDGAIYDYLIKIMNKKSN